VSLKVEWRHFSSGIVYDITDRINLADGAFSVTENAEELTVGASTLVIDDPDGDFDILGHSYIRVTETEAPDEEIIWAGFVTIRHVKRATGFLTGAQRTWTGNLDDVNTVIARRILSEDDDADRPAETDVERIQWLFDQAFLGPDDTYFSHANPVDMDAANLVGMTPYDAVNDAMLQSGKNSWQQDITTAPATYIGTTFYDFAASTVLSSDLQISNYEADITAEVGTTSPSGAAQVWAASLDTDMERDPTRIYWKIRGQYDGGTVTRTRPATAVAFAARETTASWPLVKTATAANARADRQLLDISTEEDVITTTILVHPDHVNDARAGRRIQARFSHLPGYEDWTWMRILNRTVTWISPVVYKIDYTLSPGSLSNPSGSCATALGSAGAFVAARNGPYSWDWSYGGMDQAVTLTPADPSVIIAIAGYIEHSFAPGPFVSLDSPYTLFGPTTENLHAAGYQPNTTSGGTFGANFTGGDIDWQALVAISIPTTSMTPVQVGSQLGIGGTITMGAAPTDGNILVMTSCLLGSTPSAPSGWTLVAADSSLPVFDGVHGIGLIICVRCAGPGESASIQVPDDARSHWSYVSEWTP
jgi:hypothetical protein